MNILGTGLQGLVGSRIVQLLSNKYNFTNISRSTGVDITDREAVFATLGNAPDALVIHLAAKTDVDACEQDREEDTEIQRDKGREDIQRLFKGKQTAWAINVVGTQNLVDACHQTGKKFVYISTDFVFDGEKGEYGEEDIPCPANWYGTTKMEAEKVVQNAGIPFLIIRMASPYGFSPSSKKNFVQAIEGRLENGQPVQGVTDHMFTPTYLDDIAKGIDALISNEQTGIFHLAGGTSLSPYNAALTIADSFGYDRSLVHETTRALFFQGRALRPYNLSMKHAKIEKLGIRMKTFVEGLAEINK